MISKRRARTTTFCRWVRVLLIFLQSPRIRTESFTEVSLRALLSSSPSGSSLVSRKPAYCSKSEKYSLTSSSFSCCCRKFFTYSICVCSTPSSCFAIIAKSCISALRTSSLIQAHVLRYPWLVRRLIILRISYLFKGHIDNIGIFFTGFFHVFIILGIVPADQYVMSLFMQLFKFHQDIQQKL